MINWFLIEGVLDIDWFEIVREIVWEFETIVSNFPWGIWLLIFSAVGVYLLAQKYPESVNPPESRDEQSNLAHTQQTLAENIKPTTGRK